MNKTERCDEEKATQKEEKDVMKNNPSDIQIQIKKKSRPNWDKTDKKHQCDVL